MKIKNNKRLAKASLFYYAKKDKYLTNLDKNLKNRTNFAIPFIYRKCGEEKQIYFPLPVFVDGMFLLPQ